MRKSLFWLMWLMVSLLMVGLACNVEAPAPTPIPEYCREQNDAAPRPLIRPTAPYEYQNAIAEYLNNGATPDALTRLLRDWEVINDAWGGVVANQDLNDDGHFDFVVTMFYPSSTTLINLQPPGQFLIYSCRDTGTYSVFYGLASTPDQALSMPNLMRNIDDLIGDGQPEIAFFTESCTAQACLMQPYIIKWDGVIFRSLLRYPSERAAGFPVERYEFVPDPDDAQSEPPYEFVIQESEILQVEAGPQRLATHTWTWRETEYGLPSSDTSDSKYRIHALQDADQVLLAGELDAAEEEYLRILNDPALKPWGGAGPESETGDLLFEEDMLDSYTQYRLVLVRAALRRTDEARDVFEAMDDYQTNDPSTYYQRLAATFLTTFESAETGGIPLHAACEAVRTQADDDTPYAYNDQRTRLSYTYQFLSDQDHFGYTVPDYTLENLCPF